MAETEIHRDNMIDLIETLKFRYANDPKIYVSGNMLMYYVRGNKRKHVSPDVFVVKGIAKHLRDYYLVWEEKKTPDVVIEVSSRSTRKEDLKDKFELYRDNLKVQEYFLFDPKEEYLKPSLQGFRLFGDQYVAIEAVEQRLPSEILALHLGREGLYLRLFDPVAIERLLSPQERAQKEAQARQQAELAQQKEAEARKQAEAEVERLRRELEELRRNSGKKS
jgi:Uma2 family endonuclease